LELAPQPPRLKTAFRWVREPQVTSSVGRLYSGVTLFSARNKVNEAVNSVIRPTGVTIIAILTFFVAAFLAFGGFAFLFVGVMGMTGADSGEPFSVAISAMGAAGGFSLLVLAAVAGYVAIGVLKLREWARIVSIASFGVGILCTIISLFTVMGYLVIPAVPMILGHLLVMAAAVWMLSYLLRPTVKRAFSAIPA
jgi:hypothetical protein